MANQSILKAFERMWMHIIAKIENKADKDAVPTFTLDGTTLTITKK